MRIIKKITKEEDVQPISRQQTDGFQNIAFAQEYDKRLALFKTGLIADTDIKEPAKPQQPSKPSKPAAKKPTTPKQEKPNTREKPKQKGPPKPKTPEQKRGPYNGIYNVLRALLQDKKLHYDLCPDKDDFTQYESDVLAKIDSLCDDLSDLDEDKAREKKWHSEKLQPVLNGVAMFLSRIAHHAYRKNRSAEALLRDLEARLYGSMNIACKEKGWFQFQKVIPFKSKYNHFLPKQTLVGTVDVPRKMEDLILEIQAVGLLNAAGTAIIKEAKVIIGVCE